MTRTYTIKNHEVISFTQQPRKPNHWRAWDIIEGTLALCCFMAVIGAAYILFA